MEPVLGYWNIRGLAQPIRLLLAYTETKFVDKRYEYGPPPGYDVKAWDDVKHTIGLEFPNLPYYIDDDVKLTQSIVIMRYIARKKNMEPETEEDRIRVDMVEQQVVEFRTTFAMMCYDPNFEKVKTTYLKKLPEQLELFSKYLGDRQFFASDKVTYADFLMYEALDVHKELDPKCLDNYQNLKDYLERIEKLPTIEKYMKSSDFIKWPLNGDMAYFGSRRIKK